MNIWEKVSVKFWEMLHFAKACVRDIYFWAIMALVVVIGSSSVFTIGADDKKEWIGCWGNLLGGIIAGVITIAGIRFIFDQQAKEKTDRIKEYWVMYDSAANKIITNLS